jgi:MraZ protein
LFSGEHPRTIDQKGRLTLPSSILESDVDRDWSRVTVIKGDVQCLYVYDLQTFNELLGEAQRNMDDDDGRLFMHRTLRDSQVAEVDAMKRITLPAALLKHAGIERQAVVLGMFSRLEVWEPEAWKAYLESMSDVEVPSISDLSRARIREVS